MINKTRNNWLQSLSYEATPSIDECIDTLGESIFWLYQLKETPQDPEWHAEGDVYIHTGMVLDALYSLLANRAKHITGWRRQALILATLLHDIGKPRCTKNLEINGIMRVVSPQHESIGRSYLAFALQELPLTFQVYWQVLGLVGEHHMPKLLAVKNASRGHYLALSRRVDTELLYWLEIADMTGRICPDLPRQLSHLDEFALFAEEYDVWGKPFTFPQSALPNESSSVNHYVYAYGLQAMEQDRIFHPDEALSMTYQHKNQHPEVILMCGPSGSGKSTWIRQNAQEYELISLDKIRQEINGNRSSQKNRGTVLHVAKDRFKNSLRRKQKVIWDATNLRSDFRSMIIELAEAYHALVTMVVFLLPEQALIKADQQRAYCVGPNVLRSQIESYQFPLVNESHRMIVIGKKGKTYFRTGFIDNTLC